MSSKKYYKRIHRLQTRLECSLSKISSLTLEQIDYIFSNIFKSSYLEACPGSGKTEVIGWKMAYQIANWHLKHAGIVVCTFTNSAAKELTSRIEKCLSKGDSGFPHFIGTFDSWLHGYLLHPFAADILGYPGDNGNKSYKLIDSDSTAPFLGSFSHLIKLDNGYQPISVVEYYFDVKGNIHGVDERVDRILKRFDKADIQELTKLKKRFWQNGFCTYADVDTIAAIIFKKKPEIKKWLSMRFPVFLVDECQDLSAGQLFILDCLHQNGTSLHFIGDLNQSIYEFRKVNPDDTVEYIRNIKCEHYKLTYNFRSCQPIVNISQEIIGGSSVIGKQPQKILIPCILLPYDDSSFAQIPAKYEEILKKHQLSINKSAIVARGKSTLKEIRNQAQYKGLSIVELFASALNWWFSAKRSTEDLNNSVLYLGRAMCLLAYGGQGSYKEQFCPQMLAPLEWRLVLSALMNKMASVYPFLCSGKQANWSQWVKMVKECLEESWACLPGKPLAWESVRLKLRAPQGMSGKLVIDCINYSRVKNTIRTTTIHNVKGETLDSILLLSHKNKSSAGGHYTDWMIDEKPDEEHLRFAYVACSRPKHLLVLAIKPVKASHIRYFIDMGFELYN